MALVPGQTQRRTGKKLPALPSVDGCVPPNLQILAVARHRRNLPSCRWIDPRFRGVCDPLEFRQFELVPKRKTGISG